MNYRWLKTQIKNQIKIFLHQKPKNGFTLYNLFMDMYVSHETKVSIRLLDTLVLMVFYSSLVDFYYLGPYLLNLVSSIKYICHSNELKAKTINKNFMDINTMICDLISFFNGFTRALCQDYNCYLGSEAIYNERCFLHLRKNNNDSILVICREHSGSYEYNQLKSMGQIKPKNRNIIQNDELEENKIEVKNKNILNFMKLKKNMKKKQYFGINNGHYNESNNNENETISKTNITIMTNNLDFPSESQIFEEKEKNNEYEQVLEVFDFINNITKNNINEEIKHKNNDDIIKENIYNNNKKKQDIINKKNDIKNNIFFEEIYNQYNKYNKFKTKNTFLSRNDIISQFSKEEAEFKIQRKKSHNLNKSVATKNMELIKKINFEELNNEEKNDEERIYDTINDGYKNNNKKSSDYDRAMRISLMNNFNQINNNYIDQENTKSYEQINNFDFLHEIYSNDDNKKNFFRNSTINFPINSNNTIINNRNNNIKYSLINHYESFNDMYFTSQKKNLNNNEINSYQNNNINNNIYYPTKNNDLNNNYNNYNNNCNNNSQSLVPFIPPFNNNQLDNNIKNINQSKNQNQFSQYDLSFLGGYSKTNNLKEDYLKINSSNPEIISELKEKFYYYHSLSNGCKLEKISFKGYVGINIKPPNIINNKEFYINILSEKWKDRNYFIEKNINKKMEQITGMIYKIRLQKQQNKVKLLTYSINQDIALRIKVVDSLINIYNNQLIYKFNYYQESYKFIQKIEIIIEYKNSYIGWMSIKSDGNIISNNNLKINIVYNKSINEGKIIFPNNCCNIFQNVGKISIMIHLKNSIISNMNVKLNYSNSSNQSMETLFCKKMCLLCFEYK